jgi:AraC-like DNA-binding protein
MYAAGALYREFEPCEALRPYVRAFFTFTAPAEHDSAPRSLKRQTVFGSGELLCTPLFADGHVSLVFSFGPEYRVDGLWSPGASGPRGHVIGAMSTARAASHGEQVIQVGAYLRAAEARRFTSVPACELTDRIVAIDSLWGRAGSTFETRLGEAHGDAERVALLEAALLKRVAGKRDSSGPVDLAGLAALVLARQGRLSVEQLAKNAGVSRQHLTRVFREEVGVTPKLYCRLARFRAGIVYAGGRLNSDWADVAAHLGYADQSHLIAEFREFSGLTPGKIAQERRFHPFMEPPPGAGAK